MLHPLIVALRFDSLTTSCYLKVHVATLSEFLDPHLDVATLCLGCDVPINCIKTHR